MVRVVGLGSQVVRAGGRAWADHRGHPAGFELVEVAVLSVAMLAMGFCSLTRSRNSGLVAGAGFP